MTPIDDLAKAQRLIDLYGEEALNAALHQSCMLLDSGDLVAAAAMARIAVIISQTELANSSAETLAPN